MKRTQHILLRTRFRLRIFHKVLAGYLVLTLFLSIGAVTFYFLVQQVRTATQAFAVDASRTAQLADAMEAAVLNMDAGYRGFLLTGAEVDLRPYETGSAAVGEITRELSTRRADDPVQGERLAAILKGMTSWQLMANRLISARRVAPDIQAFLQQASLLEVSSAMDVLRQQIAAFRQHEDEDMAVQLAESEQLMTLLQRAALAMPVVVLALGFFTVGAVARALSRRLLVLEQAAERIASGILTDADLPVRGSDEVASLSRVFNGLRANLRTLVGQTAAAAFDTKQAADAFIQASEAVAGTASEISEAMQNLTAGARQQSDAVSVATQVMDELGRAVTQIANGAGQQSEAMADVNDRSRAMSDAISGVARQAQTVAEASRTGAALAADGAQTVGETLRGMEEIRRTSQEAAGRVRDLAARSDEIAGLVTNIQGIAAQTNMLALNAAIEAARAGEAGRGFAVVAEEVRKLAEGTRRAADQVQLLAEGVSHDTGEVIARIGESAGQAEEGLALARAAADRLAQITASVAATRDAAEAIARAVDELTRLGGGVMEGIESAEAVTRDNTAAAEEMSAGADLARSHLQTVSSLACEAAASSTQVSDSTGNLAATTQTVAARARELVETAARLTELVARFQV